MKRFAGRPAIVTAAASGIGRAIVLRLHEEGAQVLAVDGGQSRSAYISEALVQGWVEAHSAA